MQGQVKILLVDDRAENLLALRAILEGMGHELIQAQSGEEALRHVLRHEFAVILMDVQMPGMSGFEAAELIKRREKSAHVPIIFLTAINKDDQYVFEGYSVGAVDYLFKPFNPDVLKSKIQVFIELHLKTQQIQQQAHLLQQAEQRERARQVAEIERLSEQRYRNLAEAIPQIVWTAMPDGRLTYFNRRWYEYTGLSEAESRGGGWELLLHPDDRDRDMAAWQEATRTGEALTLESRLRRAVDDSYRWHLIRAVPEVGDDGAVIGWLGTCTDIHDRILAEDEQKRLMAQLRDHNTRIEGEVALRTQELASQKKLNELILHSAAEGIVGIDLSGHITFANPAAAAMLGHPADRLVGMALHDSVHHTRPDGGPFPIAECPVHAAMFEGSIANVTDEVFWKADGSCFPVEYHSNPIVENESIIGAVLTFKDITERKRHEAELENHARAVEQANRALLEADRYKDEFLSVISHELRTPLNFIMGFASILGDEVVGPLNDDQHSYMERILYGADRMLVLVNDLLDFAKVRAGKLVLSTGETNYAELVSQVLTALKPLATHKDITLQAHVEPGLTLAIDDQRIAQVLTNLIGNGIKFTPTQGIVQVRAFLDGDTLITEVSDTGIGIEEADINNLFVRFKQLDMSATREAGGTGLGLSISKALIEAHGGAIEAVSHGKGKGSTFRFTLPLSPAPAPVAQAVPELHLP